MDKSGKISIYMYLKKITHNTHTRADPGFLDRGFKLAEGGSICAV